MEVVKMESDTPPDRTLRSIVDTLNRGGVACLPCNGTYRLFADVTNEDAVMRLVQSKRRVHKAPSLLFVDSVSQLHRVVDDVDPVAKTLMDELWPAALTIRFDASGDLPRTVVKELTKATGKVGVRIPQDDLSRRVLKSFGKPVYVSSANRGQKSGETSAAQVRQNFLGRIDYFLDNGDLQSSPSSTVVDVENGEVDVVREGAISSDEIQDVVG